MDTPPGAPERPRVPSQAPRPAGGKPRTKDASVSLPVRPEMLFALTTAWRRGDVVTSGREGYRGDGVHFNNSLHYDGLAIDVRYAKDRRRQASDYIDVGYHILAEADHLHVSFDPRGARV